MLCHVAETAIFGSVHTPVPTTTDKSIMHQFLLQTRKDDFRTSDLPIEDEPV